MYFYIKGTVVEQYGSYIVLDSNNTGYLINVANPYSFELNKEYKVFIYQQIREDDNSLYGFKTLEEKDLFLRRCRNKGGAISFIRKLKGYDLHFFLMLVQCNVRFICLWGSYGKKREGVFTALFIDS